MIHEVERPRRRLLAIDIPLRARPKRPRHILHMHRIRPQILLPQPLHLLPQRLIHPRHAQRGAQKLTRIRPIHVRRPENQQIQPLDLRQVFFRL